MILYTEKRIYGKNEMKSFFLFVHIEWLKDQKLCNKGFFKAKVNDLEKSTQKKLWFMVYHSAPRRF